MSNTTITERQLYWREHVLAAAAHDGSIVDYAQAHNLKTKDIYQWKTLLTKRGFLPIRPEPRVTEFVSVQTNDALEPVTRDVSCRITLPSGAVFELFSPITSAELPKLLVAIQSCP